MQDGRLHRCNRVTQNSMLQITFPPQKYLRCLQISSNVTLIPTATDHAMPPTCLHARQFISSLSIVAGSPYGTTAMQYTKAICLLLRISGHKK